LFTHLGSIIYRAGGYFQRGAHQKANHYQAIKETTPANGLGRLVGPGSVELPTFPIGSGRSSHRFDPGMAFRLLDFALTTAGLRPSGELLRIDEFSGAAITSRGGASVVVFGKTLRGVRAMADVKPAGRRTTQDIHGVRHG
jgi:hypothetical protein